MTLNRRIRSVVNSQVETKSVTQVYNTVVPQTGNPARVRFPELALGTGSTQRIGTEILVKGIEIEWRGVNLHPSATIVNRCTVISTSDGGFATLAANPNDPVSNTGVNYSLVVSSRKVTFPIGSGNDPVQVFRFKRRFPGAGRRVKYDATNAYPLDRGFQFDITTDSPATGIQFNGYIRVWYKDA